MASDHAKLSPGHPRVIFTNFATRSLQQADDSSDVMNVVLVLILVLALAVFAWAALKCYKRRLARRRQAPVMKWHTVQPLAFSSDRFAPL